ncbi:hypothetical protein [uncultured Gammaproteobacteria bacterium]|nr:hypothetical protein [uncultured Gammaproteobacteria bacterium]CAC9571943.1 hypothetical protein [uncultured Gammaproteobacteria bacterium]
MKKPRKIAKIVPIIRILTSKSTPNPKIETKKTQQAQLV